MIYTAGGSSVPGLHYLLPHLALDAYRELGGVGCNVRAETSHMMLTASDVLAGVVQPLNMPTLTSNGPGLGLVNLVNSGNGNINNDNVNAKQNFLSTDIRFDNVAPLICSWRL